MKKVLVGYSIILTILVSAQLFAAHRDKPLKPVSFDVITVHRINVVEPDGTLRMVISNHDSLPGVIAHRKENRIDRPQAGMLFYNDEGSENGGLIFGGHKAADGQVVDSGGSLSFDKYDANQIVRLTGVDDKDDRYAGMIVSDSPTGGRLRQRVWVGRDDDGTASLVLRDASGKKRLSLEVKPDGGAAVRFYDESGNAIRELKPGP